MTIKVTWQGSFDALCGIYCAAHLIACFTVKETVKDKATLKKQRKIYESAASDAFARLMESMEQVGLLKANKIVSGLKN